MISDKICRGILFVASHIYPAGLTVCCSNCTLPLLFLVQVLYQVAVSILVEMGAQQKGSTPGVAEGTKPIGIPLDNTISIEERISSWTKDFPVRIPSLTLPLLRDLELTYQLYYRAGAQNSFAITSLCYLHPQNQSAASYSPTPSNLNIAID